MKKDDLLLVLQEIWEETGMLNYLRILIVEKMGYDISDVSPMILYGIDNSYFELVERKKNREAIIVSEKKMAEMIIHEVSNWCDTNSVYELVFKDLVRWQKTLFSDSDVPKEFSDFIK